jgi:hypothetical protein
MTRLSHSVLQPEVDDSSLQWCEGKMIPFSVVSVIVCGLFEWKQICADFALFIYIYTCTCNVLPLEI